MTTDDALFEVHGAASVPSRPAVEGVAVEMHEPIAWVDIAPTGTERQRTGRVWAEARAVPGRGKAAWVLADPVHPEGSGETWAVLVVTAGTRHRVGRSMPAGHVGRPAVWGARAGRYVDKGERYRETDTRSPGGAREAAGRRSQAPRSISGRPTNAVARSDYENWLRITEEWSRENEESNR